MATKALSLVDTTIGKKIVMAVSGVVLFGFVIGHMLGNLQIFLGPKAFNGYSKFLHDTPAVLWGTRFAIALAFVAHVVSAVQLSMLNRRARPVGYKMHKQRTTTLAARSMFLGGLAVFLYIGYHLAHLTFGVTAGLGYQHLPLDADGIPDVYHNVVSSFRVPWCAGLYLAANVVLGLHLYHGSWSMLQTLGLSHPRYDDAVRSGITAIALTTTLGFLSVPVAILAGYVG
jgi:succinate dehydrogenase / fumarate reductase cytochrome b subunit